MRPASADETWRGAAEIKAAHALSLADAFAIATAKRKGATLVAGNDPDFAVASKLGVELRRI